MTYSKGIAATAFFVLGGFLVLTTAASATTVPVANRTPIINDDSYSTGVDQAYTTSALESVLSNDTDDDKDPLTAALLTSPTNGTLTFNTDGSFTYTPTSTWSGVDSFTYTGSDGMHSKTATVYIVVSDTQEAPISEEDIYSVDENSILTVPASAGVLANDYDPKGLSLTANLEMDVNDGTLSFNADGSFNYTPEQNWSGMESFVYKASNGSLYSSARTAVIHVVGLPATTTPTTTANTAPVANDQRLTTPQDIALSITLTGSDAEGDTLMFATSSNPAHGVLMGSSSTVTYTPATGFVGEDSFTFSVSDMHATTTATIYIAVGTSTASSTATTTPAATGGESVSSGSSGSGSSSHSSTHRSRSSSRGEVLGAETGPACAEYLSTYLRIGRDNNPVEVIKLQSFLNTEMNLQLVPSGVFDTATFNAVEDFQVKYWDTILKPWVPYGLATDHTPTGYVYKTTRWWINNLSCETLNQEMPLLP